ncbi:MAG: endo-1,4-beta-xylanase [Lachnospiraceae bacterium]|nr:endo-1,4-beta-xylanase [Lachnospiraceae bacterium]
MKRFLKKVLSAILTVALMVGVVNLVPMEVSAEGTNITPVGSSEDFSFTGDELASWYTSGDSTATLNGTKWSVTLGAQYSQAQFGLPSGVNLTNAKSITFAISEQNDCVLALKVHTDNDVTTDWGKDAEIIQYNCSGSADGLYTIDLSAYTSTASSVDVVLNNPYTGEGVASCVVDGIYIDMMSEAELNPGTGEGGETEANMTPVATSKEDISYTGDQLGKWWENASSTLNGTQWEMTFSGAYQQAKFGLPSELDLTNAKSVTFAISAQNCVLAFKVYTSEDGDDAQVVQYNFSGKNLYTIDLSAYSSVASCVGVMMNTATTEAGASSTCVFDGVFFDMKTAEEIEADKPVVDETANMTPNAASAEDKVFKGDDFVESSGSAAGTLGGPNSDEYKITFGGQWTERQFKLPESIDLSMCNSVTFALSEQTGSVSFKLYQTVDGSLSEIGVTTYENTGKNLYTIDFSGRSEVVTHVAVMLDKALTGQKCSFDGVMFDMMTEKKETYTVTYTADQFTVGVSNAQSAQIVDGKLVIKYSELNQQAKFKLPAAVNFAKCLAVTIKVSAQDGPVNFYSYSDGASVDTFNYKVGSNEYIVTPTAAKKVDTLGVQTGGETFTEGANITIDSITFLMEGKEPQPLPEDNDGDGQVTVDTTFFTKVETTSGVTVEVVEVGGQTVSEISFTEVGDYVDFEIPDSVDLAHLASIALDLEVVDAGAGSQSLEAQTVEGIEISLLDENKNVLVTGNVDVLQTNGNLKAKYIRITTTVANQNLQITTITFEIDMTLVGDIVLNGSFADADVSMWEFGNGTFVARSSSEPIIPGTDIYTWGEITNRTSNYDGFTQDITSRVEPGKSYAITFWAKLTDEDYVGTYNAYRQISLAPYSKDAFGNENYSPVVTGLYQQYCEPNTWTQFVAVVSIPGNAVEYKFRIVEQGLNWGQGDGIKGDFAITGITMAETYPPEKVTYGGGSGSATISNVDNREITFTQNYDMDEFSIDWASATFEQSAEKLTVKFEDNYDEVRLKLPRAYATSDIVSVVVNTGGQNVPIAVKLYNKGVEKRVEYFNSMSSSYTVCPNIRGSIDAIGIMSLATPNPDGAYVDILYVALNFVKEPDPLAVSDTILVNGDFADTDLSDWQAAYWGQNEGVSMFHEVSATPFGDGTTNYISYNKRTSPYQCFAQDITSCVVQNEIYTFSFWAKLSDDYIGAPADQRVVQFAPYTVDKDGVADYNPKLDGTYTQVLEPGVWTKFEGTYKVTNANEVAQVVVRILEQGTNYGQGDCVLGGYSIADVKMDLYVPDPPSIDEDVPNLDETLKGVFGDDLIVGNSLTVNSIDDIGTEMILNKHFNAITIGNELKPDALFGYSNSQHTKLQTITFNGQELLVPTLDYSRAEMVLDKIVKWNSENPDHQFKVRGHVLVWHAQTPEWFFRENYVVAQNADGSENYVTPELMNLRLEWYIKTVLEHFTGEDSEYKDLFYGWDVVNEAVSDGSGSYRTDKIASGEKPSDPTHGSNSSWWAVYGSNEYIIKAFQFANKYAPADLELYYNDYNECNNTKVKGIVKLLTDVLAAEGTRIDAMGMQAHYSLMNPSNRMFEDAIRAYAAVVGNVQITEFDMKASRDLSSEKNLMDEYAEQGRRYADLYSILKKLDAEEGIEITGITFWGVSDKDSWLQSSSNVGGGSDGTMTQCPLLFDSNYKVKPSFWAFVDYTVVDPAYGQEPEQIVDEDTPLGDVDPEAPKDEKMEEKVEQTETKTEDAQTSSDAVEAQPKKANPVPFVAAGVVAVVLIAGSAVLFLKKKK